VTHNIEEAVETASRIGVLFPNPGRLGLVLENPLPYPRDTQSAEFRKLVATIHESITRQCLPDVPAPKPGVLRPALLLQGEEPAVQSIPHAPPGQILGLLSILEDAAPGASVYTLSNAIGREFGEVISLVTAAELLGFVETPGNEVRLTELGLRFHAAHRKERRSLFAAQLQKLGLFRHMLEILQAQGLLSESSALDELAAALPYDNPQQTLHTMVSWGRYAGLLDYDLSGKRLLLLGAGDAEGP